MIYLLEHCFGKSKDSIGGKAAWLAWLSRHTMQLPKTLCLTTEAYFAFLDSGNLREKISMELHRKRFDDMRWEEIWDISLRIRNLFLKSSIPPLLDDQLQHCLEDSFGSTAVVVRSSAPTEDQGGISFAGLHDSCVNVRGIEAVRTAIKKVWASLWSDRSILYRKELGLAVEESGMGVIIQELIDGQASGICFTRDPIENRHMSIEAVHGLNQGLVDGTIAPDRWLLSPEDSRIVQHNAPQERRRKLSTGSQGTVEDAMADHLAEKPPLDDSQLMRLAETMQQLHLLSETPLDIEWTIKDDIVFLLQARPITGSRQESDGDRRSWYLSLHRSFDNLIQLRHTIEDEMLPAMSREAEEYAKLDLYALSDEQLAENIRLLQDRSSYWTERYWRDCIPFAHGIRLFGEIYNEVMVPDDPHEFVRLLQGENMLSMQRNKELHELADMARSNPALIDRLTNLSVPGTTDDPFDIAFEKLVTGYGSYFAATADSTASVRELFGKILIAFVHAPQQSRAPQKQDALHLKNRFYAKISAADSNLDGPALLDLARASYRLRDDDNIYLGKIEEQAARLLREGRKRLTSRGFPVQDSPGAEEVAGLLEGTAVSPVRNNGSSRKRSNDHPGQWQRTRARQLIGQPASTGVARGVARVVHTPQDTADFQHGEILVVESIEPTMTFFAPLAAAIVEQRGGMLIHGAIIAREYGLPCVTGVAKATDHIKTGDRLTVDGYLGIVTVERSG